MAAAQKPGKNPDEQLQLPDLSRIRLDALCSGARAIQLGTLDMYADCRQYEGVKYDWDGRQMGYAGEADIQPGWFVPMAQRKPNVRYNLGRLIRRRLTAMALGEDRWPEITVPGDPDAEDYCKALVLESQLQQRMQEARDKGGAVGTAVVSFGFVEGKPRVRIHDAKHCYPIRWVDRDEYMLGAILKTYRYPRTVYTSDGKPKQVMFYSARYWDEQLEIVWDPIPEELAKNGKWSGVKSYAVQHGFGECPVYWTQNQPDSEREDGISDIDSLEDDFDAVNRLLSATGKGTAANVDPTLVIKDDRPKNSGVIHKGSGNAIFSKGGAEYLELKGDAVRAATETVAVIVQHCLDVAGVVIGDPAKMGARALSAQALKMLYLPMCNQCDVLRTQYGTLIVKVVRGMLRAARVINATAPGPVLTTQDGVKIQTRPVVILPPRIEKTEPEEPGGETTETQTERNPGTSDRLELKWPPYFPLSMTDVQEMVTAGSGAVQGKLISQRTGVKFVSTPFGIQDVDKELADIDVETERAALQQAEAMAAMGGGDSLGGGGETEPADKSEPADK